MEVHIGADTDYPLLTRNHVQGDGAVVSTGPAGTQFILTLEVILSKGGPKVVFRRHGPRLCTVNHLY